MAEPTRWDASQYERFGDERSRPFFDLVSRIYPAQPATVVDLGCGPGTLTASLCDRWPMANVLGVDSSAEMLARTPVRDRLRFERGDITTWSPPRPVDVIVSNAALQWVPDHSGAVMAALVSALAPGGWFAVQVPANLDDSHHQAIAALATSEQWATRVGTSWRRYEQVLDPVEYADRLCALGCEVDAWETTYLHVLHGVDPVLEWVKGTALRPVLSVLAADDQRQFCEELAPILRAAYPPRSFGTPFPFRRVFAVARRTFP